MQAKAKYAVSGALAGAVNGLFGGGGGMVLVPLLSGWCGMEGKRSFATCVAVILPLSAVSAAVYLLRQGFELAAALPYLLGFAAGAMLYVVAVELLPTAARGGTLSAAVGFTVMMVLDVALG